MNRFLEFIYYKHEKIIDNPEYIELNNRKKKLKDDIDKLDERIKYHESQLNEGNFIYRFFNRLFNRKTIKELERELQKEIKLKKELDDEYTSIMFPDIGTPDIPKKIDEVEEFTNTLKNTSPDYDMLMEMYEFIHCASIIWFYNNSEESEIYNLSETTNGRKSHARIFVVKDLNGLYTITVRLLGTGVVELNTKNNKSSDSYTYHFKNNNWNMEHDIADEMGVEYAQNIIMNAFVRAFEYCYNIKSI